MRHPVPEIRQERRRRGSESMRIAVGSSHQHRTLQRAEQHEQKTEHKSFTKPDEVRPFQLAEPRS
jgi:hypothetical protein